MTEKIQKQKPRRTCLKEYSDYKRYKPHLIADFNSRCGYCDSHDKFFAGKRFFQIDHFKPHSLDIFIHLKNKYSNLIYSCQSCNRAKSNKWEEENGFIDPCDETYDKFLYRERSSGKIKHNNSKQGEFMYKNLNLYLRRHEFLWLIEKFEKQKLELNKIFENTSDKDKIKILLCFKDIQDEIDKYTNLFYNEMSK